MDGQTLAAALALMKAMPDNAASSAAEAAGYAAEAADLKDALDAATVAETIAYMDMSGSTGPADTVYVSGANPVIKAAKNTLYVCSTILETLTVTPNPSGISAVRFTSGTTATVLNLPSTVLWPDWFDGTCETERTYEISIMDGIYGAVMSWAV